MLFALAVFATSLTHLGDIAAIVEHPPANCHSSFCATGTVTYVIKVSDVFCHLLTEEDGVCVDFQGSLSSDLPRPGDLVRLDGRFQARGASAIKPHFDRVERIGRRQSPVPIIGPATNIMDGHLDFHRCHLMGELRDVEPSGTDPRWNYLSIINEGRLYYAPIPARNGSLGELEKLVGSTVLLDGYPDSHNASLRFLDERRFMVADMDHVKIVSPPPVDPFANVPSVDRLHRLLPEQISRLGRHKAVGTLLTIWQSCHALLLLKDSRKALISSSEPVACRRGDVVEVIGYPSTDGFTLHLVRANVRPISQRPVNEPETLVITDQDVGNRLSSPSLVKYSLQGRRIQLTGMIAEFNENQRARGFFSLAIAGHLLDVDFSSQPAAAKGIVSGCRVQIVGTCVLATENWAAISNGLQFNGIKVVIDKADGLTILQYPPWWTPGRLTAVVVILLLAIVGCMVWNRMLHHLSEKRGQELFRERSASALAELRTDERTRLAVELHDSLSQILTGAAMQLDAGEVGVAKRILASCRRELRSCLWDLRSKAIDAERFADAIRETLAPHLGNRQALIDIDFPSSAISESLRHAALRIIREATVNAVRHGRTTTIAISGELCGRKLVFSVADDGRGFDPTTAQGSRSGHFGILGMRERAKAFNGSVTIDSSSGNGTIVNVEMEDKTPELETK